MPAGVAAALATAGLLCLGLSGLASGPARWLLAGAALSPLLLGGILVPLLGAGQSSAALHAHQALALACWSAGGLLCWHADEATLDVSPCFADAASTQRAAHAFLGATVGAFGAEIYFVRDDLVAHHACALALTAYLALAGLLGADVRVAGPLHFIAVACPSFTCVPKLAERSRLLPRVCVDALWVGALLLWVCWRCVVLHSTYGIFFTELPARIFPSYYYYFSAHGLMCDLRRTPILFVVLDATLRVPMYLLNVYWACIKLRSVVATLCKYRVGEAEDQKKTT